MPEYNRMVIAFENGAKKKGYSFDKDDVGRYKDNWLQEAWEIFCLVNFDELSEVHDTCERIRKATEILKDT